MGSAKVRKPRINATGRNPDRTGSEDRTLIIRRSLWHSPHVSALSGAGRALMVELHSMFNGRNNGELFLSIRATADRLGFADFEAAMNAHAELQSLGLTAVALEGAFSMTACEVSRARAYRLNWIGADGKCIGGDKLPPLDFSALTAKQKKRIAARSGALDRFLGELQEKKKSSVRETPTLMADSVRESRTEAADCARESRTLESKNGQNPPSHVVRDSPTHILHHIPGDGSEENQANFPPENTGGQNSGALDIRNKIAGYFHKLSAKRQRAWAEAHGVTRDDIKRYIIADPRHLKPAKVAAMVLAIRNEKAEAR